MANDGSKIFAKHWMARGYITPDVNQHNKAHQAPNNYILLQGAILGVQENADVGRAWDEGLIRGSCLCVRAAA